MRIKILCLLLFTCIVWNLNAQIDLLTPEQMQDDVKFYYEKLLETHPNPYQVLTPEQFEKYKNELLSSLNAPLSKEDFYQKVVEFNQFTDGHTLITDWDLSTMVANDKKVEYAHNLEYKNLYPYKLSCFPEDSIALLELNTFMSTDFGVENIFNIDAAEVICDEILSKKMDSIIAMGCKHLFIDISANGGGSDDLAYKILDYLKEIPHRKYYVGKADIKVSRALRNMYSQTFSSKWEYFKIPFNKNYRKIFLSKNGKIIHLKFYKTYKSKNQIYNGNVYLIQGRGTYSAAVSLSAFFKAYKVGIVIGEETGGKTGEYLNCFPFTLPNSGLTFLCAVQYGEYVGSNHDKKGVLPDVKYKIDNQLKSFTLNQLKEMLRLSEKQSLNTH